MPTNIVIFFTNDSSNWLSWTSPNIILDTDLQLVGLLLKTSADLARLCDLTRGENVCVADSGVRETLCFDCSVEAQLVIIINK